MNVINCNKHHGRNEQRVVTMYYRRIYPFLEDEGLFL